MHLRPLIEMQRILGFFTGPTLTTEPTAVPTPYESSSVTVPTTNVAAVADYNTANTDWKVVKPLFGDDVPWNTSTTVWHAVDDRVRGGSSQSYLTALNASSSSTDSLSPKSGRYAALFSGTLDTTTLGGAGFASQSTQPVSKSAEAPGSEAADDENEEEKDSSSSNDADDVWDLSAADGILLRLGRGDAKKYTFTLKDAVPGKRNDGRDKAGISWEFVFEGPGTVKGKGDSEQQQEEEELANGGGRTGLEAEAPQTAVFMPWANFRPTYRGREVNDTQPLDTKAIRRFGLMMRSFFEEQHGPFKLEVRALEAVSKK